MKRLVTFIVAVGMAAAGIAAERELAEQTSRDRGVTVKVKPLELSPGAKAWAFTVVLETHTQELTDDLAQVATLNGAGGPPHLPTAWDGDPPGGHHRKGVLRFAPITPAPDGVELRIRRPGESAPRSFTWTLK